MCENIIVVWWESPSNDTQYIYDVGLIYWFIKQETCKLPGVFFPVFSCQMRVVGFAISRHLCHCISAAQVLYIPISPAHSLGKLWLLMVNCDHLHQHLGLSSLLEKLGQSFCKALFLKLRNISRRFWLLGKLGILEFTETHGNSHETSPWQATQASMLLSLLEAAEEAWMFFINRWYTPEMKRSRHSPWKMGDLKTTLTFGKAPFFGGAIWKISGVFDWWYDILLARSLIGMKLCPP